MQSAEKIIDKHIGPFSIKVPHQLHEAYKNALNEARIEVIKECVKKAEVEGIYANGKTYYTVNKESILKLIEQVK